MGWKHCRLKHQFCNKARKNKAKYHNDKRNGQGVSCPFRFYMRKIHRKGIKDRVGRAHKHRCRKSRRTVGSAKRKKLCYRGGGSASRNRTDGCHGQKLGRYPKRFAHGGCGAAQSIHSAACRKHFYRNDKKYEGGQKIIGQPCSVGIPKEKEKGCLFLKKTSLPHCTKIRQEEKMRQPTSSFSPFSAIKKRAYSA